MASDGHIPDDRSDSGAAHQLIAAFLLGLAALPAMAKHAERDGIGMLSLEEIAALGGHNQHKPKPVKDGTSTASFTSTATGTSSGKKPPAPPGKPPAPAPAPVSIDPRRSLMVTETTILSSFPILDVLNRLAAGSPQSMIARQLYDQ